MVQRFSQLDALPHLKHRSAGRPLAGRNDALTDLLSECYSPSELAVVAVKFGVREEEIHGTAVRSSGFGQFRMVMGNRLRGILIRLERSSRRGESLSILQAAYPGGAGHGTG